jgi:hypothetical protein
MELAQLQQSVLQLMLPAQAVRVELGPGGIQLLQLLLDEGSVLRGAAVLQLLALRLDLSRLGLDGRKRALQLLEFIKKPSTGEPKLNLMFKVKLANVL